MTSFYRFIGCSLSSVLLGACHGPYVSVQPQEHNTQIVQNTKGDKTPYDLGKAHLHSSSYGLALEAFRHDLQMRGSSVETLNGLAITYDLLGRYDLSQKYYEQAIRLNRQKAFTYNNFAYSQYQQSNYDDARLLIAKAQDLYRYQPSQTQVVSGNNALIAEASPQHSMTEVVYKPERTQSHEWTIRKQQISHALRDYKKYRSEVSMGALDVSSAQQIKWFDDVVFRVRNGTGRTRMAKRIAEYLLDYGFDAKQLANADHYHHKTSYIEYKSGYEKVAQVLSQSFDVPVEIRQSQKHRADVTLTLGADLLGLDNSLSQLQLVQNTTLKGSHDDKS